MRQKFESAKSAIAVSTMYLNPICAQLDKLLLESETPDDVFKLVVTHRGAFFVHNLVTCMRLLPLTQSQVREGEARAMFDDPRYALLIADVLKYRADLDLNAMDEVCKAMKQLDHKHFKIFTNLYNHILKHEINNTQHVDSILSLAETYHWAGFPETDILNKLLSAIESRPEIANDRQLMKCLDLSKALGFTKQSLFDSVATRIDGVLSRASAPVGQSLTRLSKSVAGAINNGNNNNSGTMVTRGGDVVQLGVPKAFDRGMVAKAAASLSACRSPAVLSVVNNVCGLLAHEQAHPALWSAQAILDVVSAMRQADLLHRPAFGSALNVIGNHLKESERAGRPPAVTLKSLCQLMESMAYFPMKDKHLVEQTHLAAMKVLTDQDHALTETDSTRVVYSSCIMHPKILSKDVAETKDDHAVQYSFKYLWRKIGSTTAWEKHAPLAFQLFISHQSQFPNADLPPIPRRTINEGWRQFALRRRGMGPRFPAEGSDLHQLLSQLLPGERVTRFVAAGPYVVDAEIIVHNNNTVQSLSTRRKGVMLVKEFAVVVDQKVSLQSEDGLQTSVDPAESTILACRSDVHALAIDKARTTPFFAEKYTFDTNSSVAVGSAPLLKAQLEALDWDVAFIPLKLWKEAGDMQKKALLLQAINEVS